jgi:mono/diheme cytochrome c family protein
LAPRIQALSDKDIFSRITNGFGPMPAFGHFIAESDRKAIVAYIRALQLDGKWHPNTQEQAK